MRTGLRKIALKRDPNAPIGIPTALHFDCPCGTRIDVTDDADVLTCPGCRQRYDNSGWMLDTSDEDPDRYGFIGDTDD